MGTFLSSSALHLSTNMKFLVLAACVAVSSAQVSNLGYGAGLGYAGYGAGLGYAGAGLGYGYSGYGAGYGYSGYGAGYGYSGPLNLNNQLIAHPNGAVVPVDEPAVVAARVDHLNAQGAAYAASAPIVAAAPLVASAPLIASAPYSANGA